MPELPDLQVFSRNLQKKLSGRKLQQLTVSKRAKINTTPAALKKALQGKKLLRVYREGKELRFDFGKHILGIHFMLRGKFLWVEKDDPPKNIIVEFLYSGALPLALSDYQYQARLTLDPAPSKIPDALSTSANLGFWKEQLQSGAAIKNLLLDQKVIRGIGNAYSDEILWDARISPFSISKKIPQAKIKSLAASVKRVLTKAEKQVSKAAPGIIGGEIREFLAIHNAKQKKSPGGALIRKKIAGGRPTYYTSEQQLFK